MTGIRLLRRVGMGAGILALVGAALFPIYYMFLTSLKPDSLLLVQPPRFWFTPSIVNYVKVLVKEGFGRYYLNSVNVALFSTLFAVLLGSMVAFAFIRIPFRGKKLMFLAILIPRSFPPIATIIPIFFAVRTLGMMDKLSTLIIFETAVRLPLVIWVMRGFFRSVPGELIEAAMLDGASLIKAFFKVVVPLASPGMVAVAILSFIDTWNAFLSPLVLTNFKAVTAPVAILSYMETEEQLLWGMISASGFLTILPILMFSLFLHRFLLRGLTAGAIK